MKGSKQTDLRSLFTLVLLVAGIGGLGWSYNRLISQEEAVDSAWAQLESNYQRRHDLIPPLVETVSRYLEHEQETIQGVVDSRGQAGTDLPRAVEAVASAREAAAESSSSPADGVPADEAALQRIARAQAQLSSQSRRLMAVVENYPDLRSADQFLNLQAQIEGAENRINVARMRFNDAVRDYNSAIRRIPGNLWASLGAMQPRAYFEADEDARNAVSPDFR